MILRAATALFAAALLGLGLAGPAAALTAEEMYEPGTVVVVDLQLPPASIAALEAEPDEYVEGTFALAPSDGTPGGVGEFSAPLTVGIRLKGEGSFRNLNGKAAFKLKFNEFVKGQRFLGLKKMTLNNMVQDPSMVHEALAYAAFGAAGVPAPRTGYADVRVNDEEFGMHLNLETLDDVALERLFVSFEGPPQHLYEGDFGVDVVPGDAGFYEVDEGEVDERSDLEALIEAVAAPSPGFSERMTGHADLEEMTRMWAVERYVGHWDGYSGRTQPHNYYLYSDPLGEFQMLPWGIDQSWRLAALGFGPPGPALFEACQADPGCRALYIEALRGARDAVAALDPGAEAQRLGALLAPWQELEAPPRKPFDAGVVAAEVAAVGTFAAKRPAALARFLGEGGSEEGSADSPVGGSTGTIPAALKLSTRLPVYRAKLGRGVLPIWVEAPGPAGVALTAHIATVRGEVRACAASRTATAAGPLALRCRLSPTVRRHLAARWLRLRIQVTVTPPGQQALTLRRAIRLPRIAR
ncbi:MAG: CotH kinase family protein [Solirubrobacterales bacterium]